MPFLWVYGVDEATCRKMIGVIYDANILVFCVEARPTTASVRPLVAGYGYYSGWN